MHPEKQLRLQHAHVTRSDPIGLNRFRELRQRARLPCDLSLIAFYVNGFYSAGHCGL